MAFVFTFPDVGEGIHEGRVVEWLVAVGDTVAEDQPLLKVETDKAVVDLPSPRAGVVLTLHVAEDAAIEVGDPLLTIGEAGEKAEAAAGEGTAAPVSGRPAQEAAEVRVAAAPTRREGGPPGAPWPPPAPAPWPASVASIWSGSGGPVPGDGSRTRTWIGRRAASPSSPLPRPPSARLRHGATCPSPSRERWSAFPSPTCAR